MFNPLNKNVQSLTKVRLFSNNEYFYTNNPSAFLSILWLSWKIHPAPNYNTQWTTAIHGLTYDDTIEAEEGK